MFMLEILLQALLVGLAVLVGGVVVTLLAIGLYCLIAGEGGRK